jgi:hypothetical protein
MKLSNKNRNNRLNIIFNKTTTTKIIHKNRQDSKLLDSSTVQYQNSKYLWQNKIDQAINMYTTITKINTLLFTSNSILIKQNWVETVISDDTNRRLVSIEFQWNFWNSYNNDKIKRKNNKNIWFRLYTKSQIQ